MTDITERIVITYNKKINSASEKEETIQRNILMVHFGDT